MLRGWRLIQRADVELSPRSPVRSPHLHSLVGRAPKTLRHATHMALIESTALRSAYLRCRPALRYLAPNESTIIVVEGFPRSANTYALAALYDANPHLQGFVAHHLHSYKSVLCGVRRGLPVVVLVRAPLDAVASLIQRYPDLSARLALRQYISFHRNILPVVPSLVVVPFDSAVAHFDGVIAEINRRSNLSLAAYDETADSEARLRHAVELMELRDGKRLTVRENAVARPSPLRIAARDAVCDRVREHRRLLEQAEMLYELIIQARRTAGEPDTEEASCRAQ